jgi:hypothetical protein
VAHAQALSAALSREHESCIRLGSGGGYAPQAALKRNRLHQFDLNQLAC